MSESIMCPCCGQEFTGNEKEVSRVESNIKNYKTANQNQFARKMCEKQKHKCYNKAMEKWAEGESNTRMKFTLEHTRICNAIVQNILNAPYPKELESK